MPPYLVAELSCNHNGSFDQARALIRAAKLAGADAVKFQAYTPDELTTPKHREMWSLYERAQTPRKWFPLLFEYAKALGITAFASAFSVNGVEFLKDIGSPAIKIASAEIDDKELICAALGNFETVVISTGMANLSKLLGIPGQTVYLHCVAQYPSRIEDANLEAIKSLQCFGPAGLSDHTPGYETAIAATALGAVMIEKHFKLNRMDDCIDAAYSLDPQDFSKMCIAVRAIWAGMGDGVIKPTCKPRQR